MMATHRLPLHALMGLLLAVATIAAVNYTFPILRVATGTVVFSVASASLSSSSTNVSALYLTIDQIMVHRENSTENDTRSWYNITVPSQTIELLSLNDINGTFPQLASANLPAGSYNQIRFHVTNATATIDGTTYILKLPSGEFKIPRSNFTVSDGGIINILITLGYESVHVNQNFILRPVAHILSQ